MNAFGKMGLLCCLAAVLLAGCGDGDGDVSAVSGAEVSIEQSGEISGSASEDISLGEISWDEVSKDYSAEKQIGESGIFIAVKKLSSSQKVYALEKGGKGLANASEFSRRGRENLRRSLAHSKLLRRGLISAAAIKSIYPRTSHDHP